MTEEKTTLLIVEDSVEIADMLRAYFLAQDYQVLVANWGEDAVALCQNNPVDLVLIDIRLPDIDGFEVANRLRRQLNRQDLPIIFLTGHRERQFRVRGLELEAQDFITKPFDIEDLRLRVQNILQRTRRQVSRNAITSLPQGGPVDERLAQWLDEPEWVILIIQTFNLSQFNEIYGYSAYCTVLSSIGRMVTDTLDKLKLPGLFFGHLNETTFTLVAPLSDLQRLVEGLQRRLVKAFKYLSQKGSNENNGRLPFIPGFCISEIHHSETVSDLQDLKDYLYVSYLSGSH